MKYSQAEILAENLLSLKDIKGSAGVKIARNLRMINDELREYYQFKQELFRKYGEEKDGVLMINKESENFPLFMKEIEPIASQEVDFDFRKITEQELIDSGMTVGQIQLVWEMCDEY